MTDDFDDSYPLSEAPLMPSGYDEWKLATPPEEPAMPWQTSEVLGRVFPQKCPIRVKFQPCHLLAGHEGACCHRSHK